MSAGITVTNADHMVEKIEALAGNYRQGVQRRWLRAIAMVMEGALNCGGIRTARWSVRDRTVRHNTKMPDRIASIGDCDRGRLACGTAGGNGIRNVTNPLRNGIRCRNYQKTAMVLLFRVFSASVNHDMNAGSKLASSF